MSQNLHFGCTQLLIQKCIHTSVLPLVHHGLWVGGYHVLPAIRLCGNGTRAALSHGEPVWEDTRNMEQEANCLYCDCQTISTKIVRTLFV